MRINPMPVYLKGQKRKRAKPTDRPYLDWLKTKPCCVCGKAPPGVPAHVRLGGRGGVGMKPLFSAVPACRFHHDWQHQHGHLDLMPTDEWLRLADEYLAEWKAEMSFA